MSESPPVIRIQCVSVSSYSAVQNIFAKNARQSSWHNSYMSVTHIMLV